MILRFLFVFFVFLSLSYPLNLNFFGKKSEATTGNILDGVNPQDVKRVNDSPDGIRVNTEYSRAKRELNKKFNQKRKELGLQIRKMQSYYGRQIRGARKKESRDRIAEKYKLAKEKKNAELSDLEAKRAKEIDKLTRQKDRKIYKLVQDGYFYKTYIDNYSNYPRDNYFIQLNSGLWLASTLTRKTDAPIDESGASMIIKSRYQMGYQPFYSLSVGYINSSINQHMDVEVIGTNLFTEEAELPSALLSLHLYSFNYYFDFKGFSKSGYVIRSFVKTGIGILTIEPTGEQEELEIAFTVGAGYYGRLAENLDWVMGIDVTTGQFKRFTNTEGAKIRNVMLLNRIVIGLRYLL